MPREEEPRNRPQGTRRFPTVGSGHDTRAGLRTELVKNRRRTGNARSHRVGDLLLEFVSRLLAHTLNDARIRGVTLTDVDMRPDLRHARIYFTVRDGGAPKEEALLGLRGATGFIRGRIAGALKLRFVPAIEFVHDETLDRARRIEDLLKAVGPKE